MESSELDRHLPLLELLAHRKDWRTLTGKCLELLAMDPENFQLLCYLAIAYSGTGWEGNVEPVLQSLLRLGGNVALTHQLVARYWLHRKQTNFAYWHARKAIELDPLDADSYYITGFVMLQRNWHKLAVQMFAKARSLDVSETKYAEMELNLRAVVETSLEDRVQHKTELLALLEQNPNSSTANELLGDFYAGEMRSAKQAIEFYKSALLNDPTDRDIQLKLRKQIPKQNVFSRTLFLPLSVADNIATRIRNFNLRTAVVLVLGIKGVLIALLWFVIMLALLGLPAKCYEWLFMADLSVLSFKSAPVRRIMIGLKAIPFWLRIGIVSCLWIAFWSGILGIFGLTVLQSLYIVGAVFGVHLFIIWLASVVRWIEVWYAESQRGKSVRQQLFLILKLGAAFNLAMFLIAVITIGLQLGQWLGQSQAFAWIIGILVGLWMIVNAFTILKCMMIWKHKIPIPSFQPTQLPPVGPPPPLPGMV